MSARDYRNDAELAIAAALAAGTGIMRVFGTEMKVIHKSPDQPLTEADLAADRLLKDMLMSGRPGYGWLSEETADNPARLERAFLWVVDPIDGTRSFVARRPEFSVSIALAERGAPVVGVIHNPATGELFWAVKDGGAWERVDGADQPMQPQAAASRDGRALLLASRSEIANGAFEPYVDSYEIEGVGSTAYKMALVAAGRADAFLSRGPKSEWDVCAGVLIAEEAGVVVTDADGGSLSFNRPDPFVRGVLCATSDEHASILKLSREQGATQTGVES